CEDARDRSRLCAAETFLVRLRRRRAIHLREQLLGFLILGIELLRAFDRSERGILFVTAEEGARAGGVNRRAIRHRALGAIEISERGVGETLFETGASAKLEDFGERFLVTLEVAEKIELEIEDAHALADVRALRAPELDRRIPGG